MMKTQRISGLNIGLMVSMALFFDLLSLIPIVNIVTGLLGSGLFLVWFYFLGVSFGKNRKMIGVSGIFAIIEVIPFLSIIPGLTMSVITNIIIANKGAREESQEEQKQKDNRNAFEKLRDQRTHTSDEIRRLNRAREVMRTGIMRPGESRDEVIASAYQTYQERNKNNENKNSPLQEDVKPEERAEPSIDAYEALKMKRERSTQDQEQLRRAEEIRGGAQYREGELENPVYRAAYEKRDKPDQAQVVGEEPGQ